MKLLRRLSQPETGAATMLALLAAIELGRLAANLYSQGLSSLLEIDRNAWMLVSALIAITVAWRLLRYPLAGKALRRNLLVVIIHALACWRFLSIELAVLATLPVFALAAAWWLHDASAHHDR